MFGILKKWFSRLFSLGNVKQEKYVDLGLSVKWASKNVGAETSADFGDYFDFNQAQNIEGIEVPTIEQWEELIKECKFKYEGRRNGFVVIGKNKNRIFFPFAGEKLGQNDYKGAYFWSASTSPRYQEKGKFVGFWRILHGHEKFIGDVVKNKFWISVRGIKSK